MLEKGNVEIFVYADAVCHCYFILFAAGEVRSNWLLSILACEF